MFRAGVLAAVTELAVSRSKYFNRTAFWAGEFWEAVITTLIIFCEIVDGAFDLVDQAVVEMETDFGQCQFNLF